jgi:hypothetical protein
MRFSRQRKLNRHFGMDSRRVEHGSLRDRRKARCPVELLHILIETADLDLGSSNQQGQGAAIVGADDLADELLLLLGCGRLGNRFRATNDQDGGDQ